MLMFLDQEPVSVSLVPTLPFCFTAKGVVFKQKRLDASIGAKEIKMKDFSVTLASSCLR